MYFFIFDFFFFLKKKKSESKQIERKIKMKGNFSQVAMLYIQSSYSLDEIIFFVSELNHRYRQLIVK
jgi:hypothetical protein